MKTSDFAAWEHPLSCCKYDGANYYKARVGISSTFDVFTRLDIFRLQQVFFFFFTLLLTQYKAQWRWLLSAVRVRGTVYVGKNKLILNLKSSEENYPPGILFHKATVLGKEVELAP